MDGAECLVRVKWLSAVLGHMRDPWDLALGLPCILLLAPLGGGSWTHECSAHVCHGMPQAHLHKAAEELFRQELHHVGFHLDFARSILVAEGLVWPQI